MKALLIATLFPFSVLATVHPTEPADFGPMPKNFMDTNSRLPFSTRLEMDLKNIQDHRAHRIEIFKARIQLLQETIAEVKAIAASVKGPLTKRYYALAVERLEKKHFPSHLIHKNLAEIENPESRHEKLIHRLIEQARYYEANPDSGMVFVDHEKLKNELQSSYFAHYDVAGRIYSREPYWVLRGQRFNEMDFYFREVLPSDRKDRYLKCSFDPMARLDRAPEEEFDGVPTLIEDAAVIEKVLDQNLEIVCGKKALGRDFHYDIRENRLYNYRYFDFERGRFVDSSFSPTKDGVTEIRKALGHSSH